MADFGIHRNARILLYTLASLHASVAAGQPTNDSSKELSYRDVAPEIASRYLQRTIELVPDREDKEALKKQDPQSWVSYGVGVCRGLAQGTPELTMRSDGSSFFGPAVANAMVDAAIEVICPSHR